MAASRTLPQFVGSSSPQKASVSLRDWADLPRPGPAASLPPAPLSSYFDTLFAAHGPQHWWPGRTRFEVIVGAILTQNTSWTNVERAIRNLRTAHLLSPIAIRRVTRAKLAQLLRPSGYFRQKSKTLKTLINFLFNSYGGSLTRMFSTPTPVLRDQLLNLRGIGSETADSILLYAGKHSVFVVDAYTRRILERHGHMHPKLNYDQIRNLFESSLPANHQLFNEFHALIVHTGKHFCHKTDPRCSQCPLNKFLPTSLESPTIIAARHRQSAVTRLESPVTFP
jgi:endonuclease III related protein